MHEESSKVICKKTQKELTNPKLKKLFVFHFEPIDNDCLPPLGWVKDRGSYAARILTLIANDPCAGLEREEPMLLVYTLTANEPWAGLEREEPMLLVYLR